MSKLSQFSGNGILASVKSLVTMKSGKAVIKSVEVVTSNSSGEPTVKITFESVIDARNGHVEYLRLSRATNFQASFNLLKYLFVHSGKEEHKQLLAKLEAPMIEATDKDGKHITCESHEEFQELSKLVPGLDFLFRDQFQGDTVRECYIWKNKQKYAESFAEIAKELIGSKYQLRIGENDKGFQRLERISEAII